MTNYLIIPPKKCPPPEGHHRAYSESSNHRVQHEEGVLKRDFKKGNGTGKGGRGKARSINVPPSTGHLVGGGILTRAAMLDVRSRERPHVTRDRSYQLARVSVACRIGAVGKKAERRRRVAPISSGLGEAQWGSKSLKISRRSGDSRTRETNFETFKRDGGRTVKEIEHPKAIKKACLDLKGCCAPDGGLVMRGLLGGRKEIRSARRGKSVEGKGA